MERHVSRRALLAAAGVSALSCSRGRSRTDLAGDAPSSSGPPALPTGMSLLDLSFEGASAEGGAERAVVLSPPRGGGALPLLVALHGRGEAVRGAEAGAYGWTRDYQLPAAIEALSRGRLTAEDMQGFVAPERLSLLNQALAARPYGGMVVVCPHVPDLIGARNLDATLRYGTWLVEKLLPRVRAELGAPAAGDTGIDGVSLGGRVALIAGLAHPEAFAAVGALQPAFKADEADDMARRAASYAAARAGGRIRLLTSDEDPFQPAVGALDEAMTRAAVRHETLRVRGPHDYAFNRGPGGIEMLLWHDRVLRGLAVP